MSTQPTAKPTASDAAAPAFARRGFYLHACWEFEHPFAVRTWSRDDYANMFEFLQRLGFNLVMLWPLTEAMPAPLSEEDRQYLQHFREIVADAQARQLECWLTLAPNVTSRPEIAERPASERHLYPFRIDVRLDEAEARDAFLGHRATMLAELNNADAYVTIDGDPGSYPGARPQEFLTVLQADRATIDAVGTHPQQQKIVPWLWSGWGADWEKNGVWKEPLEPLTAPLLDLIKNELTEPWELLPGRSFKTDWANGRTNFDLAERAGLIEKSVLLCYEIIEFEPTPPACVLQFEDIRRVLREEMRYVGEARGIIGNAQQPIMVLPNLYFFSRATQDPKYLDETDETVLRDLADFLGGPPEILVPAWQCLYRGLDALPPDLPQQLGAAQLSSEAARLLPGGPERYLEILARLAQSRLEVLTACAHAPVSADDAEESLYAAVCALADWWKMHRYVFSGESGEGFSLTHTHYLLSAPLYEWCRQVAGDRRALAASVGARLCADSVLTHDEAESALKELLQITGNE